MNVSKLRWAVGIGCSLLCLPALAVLGGSPSVASNAVTATSATSAPAVAVRSAGTGANAYRIQETQTATGTVREYVDAKGTVFCVAWNGGLMPNLQSLFGDYYQRYVDFVQQRRETGIRGPVQMQAESLVVESGGRMRHFVGRAYVPSLLPANVDLEALQ